MGILKPSYWELLFQKAFGCLKMHSMPDTFWFSDHETASVHQAKPFWHGHLDFTLLLIEAYWVLKAPRWWHPMQLNLIVHCIGLKVIHHPVPWYRCVLFAYYLWYTRRKLWWGLATAPWLETLEVDWTICVALMGVVPQIGPSVRLCHSHLWAVTVGEGHISERVEGREREKERSRKCSILSKPSIVVTFCKWSVEGN